MNFDESKVLISYGNYKGGVNNLTVATYGYFGISATSTNGKKSAINNLKRKIKRYEM